MSGVKKMQQDDYQQMFDLAQYAFQVPANTASRERIEYLADHSVNYGSFEGDNLASQVMMTPFHVNFFGQKHRMAGVGFVSSDPSFRGGGRIDEIMKQLLNDCRENGVLFSYLAPFSYPFYRRYGYELIFERVSYQIPSHAWPKSTIKTTGSVRRVNWEQAKEALQSIYAKAMKKEEGYLIREDWWTYYRLELNRSNYFAIYYDENNEAKGYLVYQINQGVFTCIEWQYLTKGAKESLNRYISSHIDSVKEFKYEQAFKQSTPFFETATPLSNVSIRPEMMVKIVDVEAFLKIYPFEGLQQSFAIEIESDVYGPWNQGIYEIQASNEGTITINKVEQTTLPKLTTSIQRFTQLFLGYKTVEELLFHEFLEVDTEAIELIESILPKKSPILEDYF